MFMMAYYTNKFHPFEPNSFLRNIKIQITYDGNTQQMLKWKNTYYTKIHISINPQPLGIYLFHHPCNFIRQFWKFSFVLLVVLSWLPLCPALIKMFLTHSPFDLGSSWKSPRAGSGEWGEWEPTATLAQACLVVGWHSAAAFTLFIFLITIQRYLQERTSSLLQKVLRRIKNMCSKWVAEFW